MQQPRMILHAALQNLRLGRSIEENVFDAIEVISHSAELADTVLTFQKRRPNSDFSSEQAYADISRIGEYTTHRWQYFGLKGISFRKGDSLDFVFRKRKLNSSDYADDLIEIARTAKDGEQKDLDRALLAVIGGKDPRESTLGNIRSLKHYDLYCVTASKIPFLPWIIRPKKTIYSPQ